MPGSLRKARETPSPEYAEGMYCMTALLSREIFSLSQAISVALFRIMKYWRLCHTKIGFARKVVANGEIISPASLLIIECAAD